MSVNGQNTYKACCHSDIGWLEINGTEAEILSVIFTDEKTADEKSASPCVDECVRQLKEYFRGERTVFELNIAFRGTEFQNRVWRELLKIPYGTAVSYKDVAIGIGNEKACRAVGNANGKNMIALIVPCHRVVRSGGKLGGYGSGLWRKKWLLNHEKNFNLCNGCP